MSHIEHRTYTDEQYEYIGMLESWTILLDIHNAVQYGFAENRLPEPGRTIDVEEAEKHVRNIEKEWSLEANKRDLDNVWTGAPPFSRMPVNAKLYLHSVLRDAWKTALARDKDIEQAFRPF